MNDYILFRVTRGHSHRVIVWAKTREDAKKYALSWLGGDPETYEVEPLTNPGDTVQVIMTLNV